MFCAARRSLLSVLGVAALSSVWVRAQSDSSLCATDCADAAAVAVGCVGTNVVECSCLSPLFFTIASECVGVSCSLAVQEEARQNYNSECGPFIAGSSSLSSVQTAKATASLTLTFTATIGGVVSTITTAINPATVSSSVAVQPPSQNTVTSLPAFTTPTATSSILALPFTSLSAADRPIALERLPIASICVLFGGLMVGGLAAL